MYYVWNNHLSLPVEQPNSKPPTFLPWCTAIIGYQKSSNNSNSQQQPSTGYRQTSKPLPGTSGPTRVKTSTNRIHTWQFKYSKHYAYCSMHEQWFNLWLYHWSWLLPVHKRSITSWETCCNPLEFYNYYLVYYSYINAANYWQLTYIPYLSVLKLGSYTHRGSNICSRMNEINTWACLNAGCQSC